MKSGTTLLLLALLAAAGAVRADYDHDEIKRLRDTGQSLPLETIIGNYRRQYQGGRILEADLEFQEDRYVYELEILQDPP